MVNFIKKWPDSSAWIPHVVPYIAWLFIMQMLGDPAGWKYAFRTVVCVALFMYFRPWQWYPRLNPKYILPSLGVGIGVFIMWVLPETPWLMQFAWWEKAYYTVGFMPPWDTVELDVQRHYAPEVCGWGLTLMRIVGSAFVIAFIEEFFFRGWMYRWAIKENFLTVDPGVFQRGAFIITALMFASVHQRWFVGLLCGIIYGLFAIRTKDIWAVGLAHCVTNLLLGIYVVWSEQYAFWS